MHKPVLVTGAYGFIGRHVARQLAAQGQSVIGLGHGTWSREEWRSWGLADWHAADVTFDNLVTYAGRPDAVVHCAGSGSVAFSTTHPYQDYQRTVATTASVLEFVRLYAPSAAVVYPSSAAVYGQAARVPIAESDPARPISPYGVHKHVGEMLCATYASHFGIRTALVRLFSVYGNGLRKQLLWDACSKLSRGETTFFGTGNEKRDWVHVTDAAELLALACGHASRECAIVNGGTGTEVSVRQVVQEILAALGRNDVPQFTGTNREGDPPAYVADVERVSRWNWKPRTPWRTGIREYVEWFSSDQTK